MATPTPDTHPPKAREKDEPADGIPQNARVVGIVYIGVQPEWSWNGQVNPAEEQFELTYELPSSLRKEDKKPHWISECVPVDFKEDAESPQWSSRLMKRIKAVCPNGEAKGGRELTAMLDKPCMVIPQHNKKGYATLKAASVCGLPPGTDVPALANNTFAFLDWDTATKEDFEAIRSPMTKKRIQGANNYATSQLKARIEGTLPAVTTYDEDMPF